MDAQPLLAIRLGWLFARHLGFFTFALGELFLHRGDRSQGLCIDGAGTSGPLALRAIRIHVAMLGAIDEFKPIPTEFVALLLFDLVRTSKDQSECNDENGRRSEYARGHCLPPVVTEGSYHDFVQPCVTSEFG